MQPDGRFTDQAAHATLAVSPGWTVLAGYAGTLVTIAEPPSERPGFAANVNVIRYEDARGLDAQSLLAESVEAMSVLLTDFVPLEQEVADGRARLLYAFRQGIYGLTAEQRYVLGTGEYWVVTGTTRSADAPEKLETIRAVLDSFDPTGTWTPPST